jgi:hypothetical protein
MPDLRQDVVTEWLASLEPTRATDAWPSPLRALETEADAPALFEELGHLLDQFGPDETEALTGAVRAPPLVVAMRGVLAQAGAARLLRILHWLGDERGLAQPHLVVAALTEGGAPEARALRAAVAAFTRRTLLDRLFAPDRLAALQGATQTAMTESRQ